MGEKKILKRLGEENYFIYAEVSVFVDIWVREDRLRTKKRTGERSS